MAILGAGLAQAVMEVIQVAPIQLGIWTVQIIYPLLGEVAGAAPERPGGRGGRGEGVALPQLFSCVPQLHFTMRNFMTNCFGQRPRQVALRRRHSPTASEMFFQ